MPWFVNHSSRGLIHKVCRSQDLLLAVCMAVGLSQLQRSWWWTQQNVTHTHVCVCITKSGKPQVHSKKLQLKSNTTILPGFIPFHVNKFLIQHSENRFPLYLRNVLIGPIFLDLSFWPPPALCMDTLLCWLGIWLPLEEHSPAYMSSSYLLS